MAVLDASVLTGLLRPDDRFHADCRAWFKHSLVANEPMIAPAIAMAETCSAIRRSTDDRALAKAAYDEFESESLIELAPIDIGLARVAGTIAIDLGIRGCDAIYVALAYREGMPLVTLDRQQGRRASELIEVTRPTGEPDARG